MRRVGFILSRVLLPVTPLTKAFKVLQRVIQVVTVFVVNLASTGFSASFAGTLWFQAVSGLRRATACLCLSSRVTALRQSLAGSTAVSEGLEAVTLATTHLGTGMVLTLRAKRSEANRTSLGRVGVCHLLPILLYFAYQMDTV